jgi:NitT/TauT family transport system substrate-binding protein
MEAEGIGLTYFKYADFGVNTLTIGVAANNSFLLTNGALVQRFVRATVRGWAEARKDPAAAIETIFKSYPQYREQKKVLVRQLELSFPLLETPNTKGKPLGWMAKEDWQQTQQILAKYAGLEKESPVEQYFTNEYIP